MPKTPLEPNERRILAFSSVGHFMVHFFMLVFPVLLLPMARAFGAPVETVLPTSFLMYLLYGVLAMPWGFLSDRFGPRFVLGAGLIIAGLGFCLSATVTEVGRLPLSLSMIGIGCAAYHPAGLAMLSKGLRNRGRAMGFSGVFGNLGIASAPFAAGVLNYLIGWRATLAVIGGIGVVLGFACLLVRFSVERGVDRQEGTTIGKKSVLKLFLGLCFVMAVHGLMYRGFTVSLPSILENRLVSAGADRRSLYAALVTGVVYLIGMSGQLLGGRVADRRELKSSYLLFFAIALPMLFLFELIAGPASIVVAGLFAFFVLGVQPIENSMYAMLTPTRWRSLAYGLMFTVVFGLGSLSVFLVNLVERRWGIESVILLLLGYLGLVILLASVLNLIGRKQALRHTPEADVVVPDSGAGPPSKR